MRTSGNKPLSGAFVAAFLVLGAGTAAQAADGTQAGSGGAEVILAAVGVTAGPALPADPGHGPLPRHEVALAVPEDLPSPGALPSYGPLGLLCAASLTAEPAPGATVDLTVQTPCLAGEPVTLRHGPLEATYLASSSGVVRARFPAFDPMAEFTAVLSDGQTLAAAAAVPGASGYERMVTMWPTGGSGLSVHAYEFGAGPGGAGHVWHGAPRQPAVAEAGRGGYLLELGTPGVSEGRMAEVYSFPAVGSRREGAVRLALSAEVTPETCGRPIEAVTLQIGDGLPGAPVAVSLPVPDCGTGQATDLVLKNLARDLRIGSTD
ncbi:MAG: hypothetical protein MUE98_02965 [Rhodobacteraceae bacterium]|jgi:hypothetical protein|nr:hypothetical protein [Paracoccaceae bacterium]